MAEVMRWVGLGLAGTLLLGCGEGEEHAVGQGPSGAQYLTVTLSAQGASPRNVVLRRWGELTFLNVDSVAHQVAFGEHPEHTSCPWRGLRLEPGKRFTLRLITRDGSCPFHDELNPRDPYFQGWVSVSASNGGSGELLW